ncbi:murein biosynthesis integral membrane protein MurJ [Terrarubrum flagellatum]|uniref:murein biosynthesis integral membrane protein MurJ n=1 Tax=Terrirubrum flagellatum TaxID=2895980 RepID=UPI0031456E29
MFKNILSVGGITLVSRVTGFFRDVVLAAALGAGPLADAFVVAMRLPNMFRSLFGEGAFSAAYVPSYTRLRTTEGPAAAQNFAAQIQTVLLASQLILLAIALVAMPWVVRALAPGFAVDDAKFDLAVTLSRITFPYLLFMTLVTQLTGSLNAVNRFAAGAFAPVLLNLSMIAALLLAFLFPSATHAAAWGVTFSGVAQLLLLVAAAKRADVLPGLVRPTNEPEMRDFWRAFWPAVIGSSGVQIAVFVDLILSTLLPAGGPATIYYADRIYQLPIGVLAIAGATVLLPEMSRRIAAGDVEGAHRAQSRIFAFTLALSGPVFAAILAIPDLIMRAAFVRGDFTTADASASAAVLAAYGLGLPAIVLIGSAVASFRARGDTKTPMLISFAAIGINVLLKIALAPRIGAPGLAFATAVGAWINLIALVIVARKRGLMQATDDFSRILAIVALATIAAGATYYFAQAPVERLVAMAPWLRDLIALAIVGFAGCAIYAVIMLAGARAAGVKLARR